MKNQLIQLYFSLRDLAEPLLERVSGLEALEYLFYRYGWEISLDEAIFDKISQGLLIKTPLEEFLSVAGSLQQQLGETPSASPSAQDIAKLAASANTLIQALADLKLSSLTELPSPLGDQEFWTSIADHLFDDLLEEYLRIYHPNLYLILHFGGAIRYDPTEPSAPFRRPYSRVVFDWAQVLALVQDPLTALRQTYSWADPGTPFEHRRFLVVLANVLQAIRLPTAVFPASLRTDARLPVDSGYQIQTDVDALRTTFLDDYSVRDQTVYEIGLEFFPAAKTGETIPSGLILSPVLRGGSAGELPLGNSFALRWSVAASAGDALGIALFPDKTAMTGGQVALGTSLEIASTRTEPWNILGKAGTARIQLNSPSIRLSIEGTAEQPEARLHLKTSSTSSEAGCRVIVPLGDSDSFVKDTVNRDSVEFCFSPEIIWSSETGLTFNGRPALDIDLPLNITLGSITLRNATIAVNEGPKRTSTTGIACRVGLGIHGKLGPVLFVIERLGFVCNVIPYTREDILALPHSAEGPVLGNLGIELNFAPPRGVGLEIDASAVAGGGYLRFDPEQEEYSGMLELQIAEKIAVKGIGLLTTRMPGGRKGYSLVVIIFAEGFAPIQLGLGFTLTGIGGLLAINRTFDEAVLRAGLRNHTLDSILFPNAPVRNAPQILSNLNKVFPPTSGHHLFGPMVQLAWGTPPLLTADLALVLELGARKRLLILAQLVAILPRRDNDLLRLQMDAVGVLDFDQGTAALDATLYDSRLLNKFVLTGDMAMRLKWEGAPSFALAIGGLHPAFNPPRNFPKLKRIAIDLSAGDNPRFRAEAYFAITANTVQFGARAELRASGSGFTIQGETGFDVLIQLDPFQFLADFYAQLQLKRGSTNLFKVRVEGALAGPRPLHLKAKATFEIFWWDVSIRVDKTLFAGEQPPRPEPVDVLPRLKAALTNRGNWTGHLPDGQRPMVTLRAVQGAANEVLLHPLGILTVKQGVVPLNLEISRFGQAAPAGARVFTISIVSPGVENKPPHLVKDFFAPAQFFEMSDDEKLSRPSFELMAAGVSIGSDQFVFADNPDDWLEVKAIAFETIIVDKEKNETRRSGQENLYTLSPELLGRQARFGAAGISDLRRTGKAKYRTARVAHRVAKEGWSIVATGDLSVQPVPGIEAGKSASYSEAAQALRKMQQEDPAKATGFKILRSSELL